MRRKVSTFFLFILLPSLSGVSGRVYAEVRDLPEYAEAQGLMALKKWDDAILVLRRLSRADQTDESLFQLSKALVYSGRREEALSLLVQASNKANGNRRDLFERRVRLLSRIFISQSTQQLFHDGLTLAIGRKWSAARERLEKALKAEPDHAEILLRLGQCLVMEADYDSAAERLRLARKLNPYEPQIRLWLGKALQERGELSEAIDELKSALSQLKDSEQANAWLAEALARDRNRASVKQARALLDKALAQLQKKNGATSLEDELGLPFQDEAEFKQQLEALRDRVDQKAAL